MAGVLTVTYGPSGVGKTTDMVAAFPRAKYIANVRALRPSMIWGFEIPEKNVRIAKYIRDVNKIVEEEVKAGNDVVIDDLSPLADYTVDAYFNGLDGHTKCSGYEPYNRATSDVLHLRKIVEFANVHVAMNAHLGHPHINKLNGAFVRGGPQLPGFLPERIVTAWDVIVRLESDDLRNVGWKTSYRCTPEDGQYAYKDRHGVADKLQTMPANLRELLLTAGYALKRPPGMEWMDQVVENGAQYVLARIAAGELPEDKLNVRPEVGKFLGTLRGAIDTKYTKDERQQNWVIRDIWDRAQIRHRLNKMKGAGSIYGG